MSPKLVGALAFLPERRTLRRLRTAVQDCRGCELYRAATQAVFGEGPATAKIVLVGEQPGDEEDRQGHPFVGPAGKLLNRALHEAGIDNRDVYVTNVVKHFKFEERGKRRIHKKPRASEVAACNPWLETEMDLIKPAVIVCLGATATQAILGRSYRLTKKHGNFVEHAYPYVTATLHPSAILRAPDAGQRHEAYAQLVADLVKVRHQAAGR
jgi:uracil-DNA glycosylase family protein